MKQFYIHEYQPLTNHRKTNFLHMSPFIKTIEDQIETCIKNNIQERFLIHIKRFINETTHEINKDEVHKFKYNILSGDYKSINPIFFPWIQTHFNKIFQTPIEKSIHFDLKSKPLNFLKGMIYMTSILEGMGKKIFHTLPLRKSNIPCNITINNSGLADYFFEYENGKRTEQRKSLISEQYRDFMWSQFLDLNHKVFRNKHYTFHHQIQTDGISCSILFVRKDLFGIKLWNEKNDIIFPNIESLSIDQRMYILNNCNVVGCDPGKRSLVYMHDSKGNKLQYTAPQRRFESKSKTHSNRMFKLRKEHGIVEVEDILSEYNSKSVNFYKFREYINKKVYVNSISHEFYEHIAFRKMKLRTFIEGKRSEDKFISYIGKIFGNNCIIAYGNWSRSNQMNNFMPTLGVGMRRLIHRKYHTFTVNEAYTSKLCSDCNKSLRMYKDDKTRKNIHRLLVCDNCINFNCFECVSSENKKITFKNRDKNAAINIMNVAKWYLFRGERHPHFTNFNFCSSTNLIGVS